MASSNDSFSAVREEFIKTLQNTKIQSLKFAPKAIVLDHQLNPKAAIETLLQYKIRAAPVIQNGNFVGVLDLRDTVKYALETYSAIKNQNNNEIEQKIQQKEAKQYLTNHNIVSSKTLTELSSHRQFKYVKHTDSLYAVAKLFAGGAHVIGVVNTNQNNQLIGIITQGYFFRQIVKKWIFSDNSCLLQQIASSKYMSFPVKQINKNIKAFDAFKVMVDCDLSGLAVINNEGVIIHNTSATDIKLWLLSNQSLEETIERFLISVRNLSLIDKYPVSAITLKDSLKRAIQMLDATKYHRIWIVNELRQPVGVLAITDVFQFICKSKE